MYTRCPSCRSEISFEPPANMEALPDGYKHRIKCPCCGVTIGVKINKVESAVVQPSYNPYNQQAQPAQVAVAPMADVAPVAEKPAKKSGVSRNVVTMLLSLLFVAIGVIGYFVSNGTINVGIMESLSKFDGISTWEVIFTSVETLEMIFAVDTLLGIVIILPLISFTLAGINFIVAFISACGKKFSRVWNFLSSLIISVSVALTFFDVVLVGDCGFVDFFKALISSGGYLAFVVLALAVIQFVVGLVVSLKPMKVKRS